MLQKEYSCALQLLLCAFMACYRQIFTFTYENNHTRMELYQTTPTKAHSNSVTQLCINFNPVILFFGITLL